MKNTEANWDRIKSSNWGNVYLTELYWLAKEAHELCLQVFEAAPAPAPGESYYKVDHKVHRDIYRILNHAARIGALIKDRPRRQGNQSAGQYEIQHKRVTWLRGVLDGLELKETLNSKVRHSLEHFDEFIDETALKSSRGNLQAPTIFPLDMALGRRDTIEGMMTGPLSGGSVYPLRVYVAETQLFLNCGRQIDLGKIAAECSQIHERVAAVAPYLAMDTESGERGTQMLVMGEGSYGRGEAPAG